MKSKIAIWQLWGFASVSFLGTVLHFAYEWLDEAIWIAPFSGVNESTWEHMKLMFWPMILFAVIQSFFFKDRSDFPCVKLLGALVGIGLIPTLFYGYNALIGKSPDWINISIFFISAAAAYIFEARLLQKSRTVCKHPHIAVLILMLLAVLFVLFTFKAPKLPIFLDPITNKYGI